MFYIRTDMNNTIATGHIMRCLSVADAAKSRGMDTTFILADTQAVELLERRGYRYIVLGTQWNCMDEELMRFEAVIRKHRIRNLLLDSYQVTQSYLMQLSLLVQVFYIDDLNRFIYPVKGLICYANYWEKFNYPGHYQNTELYLGTQYAPLRKEFHQCGEKIIKTQVKNLLLMSGGSDPYDFLGQVIEKLKKESYQRIDVICGLYYEKDDILRSKYAAFKNVYVHKAVKDIDQYMKQADVVISAGGTALYELCAVGTPAISYSMADNQLDNVIKFHEMDVIPYAGDIRQSASGVVQNILALLCEYKNTGLRETRSRRMQSLVDGKGAARIADILLHI